MEQKNYIAYLRQSTVKQELSGLGIEAQREIIRNYLKDKKAISEYIETESGKKSDRPKLIEALSECRKTGATLIVAKLDRLSRNVAFTSKLLESDVEIVFCDFPEANKLVLHIISSIAEYEAGLISQRTKQSLRAKKARGVSLGKPENLLGKLDQAIENSNQTNRQKALDNPNNRRAISMLKILAKEDKSLSEMARILNKEGFVTAKGGSNSAVSVRKRCQLDLPHQVILQGLRRFALVDRQLVVNVVTAGAGWCTSGVNGVPTGIERQLFRHLFLFERVGGVQRFTVLRFAGVDFFMSVDLLKQRITLQRLL